MSEIKLKKPDNTDRTLDRNISMQLMFDATPMCCMLWDRDLKIIDCNEEAVRLFDLSDKKEFCNRFYELCPETQPCGRPTREKAAYLISEAFDCGYLRFEWMHQKLNGQLMPAEVTLVRLAYNDDFVIAGYIRDLTEQKELLYRLEAEKSTLQTIFDSVPDLIFCKDLDLNYSRCNKSLLKYFGLTEDQFIGKNDRNGLGFPEEMADELVAMDNIVINEKKEFRYEEHLPAPDGNDRLFEASKVPLLHSGKVIGIMGIARDITERKAMEEAAMNANKAKSSFLSTMSHEIRTPMNAILGITEMHLLNNNVEPYIKEAFEKIYSSGDLLLSIINDILDLSKIESGKMEILNANYEIASLISDTAQLNMMRIGSKPIEFHLNIDENTPSTLCGDELRIKQILNNLLSNSFKYTTGGDVSLTVTTQPFDDDKDGKIMLNLCVNDTGQGMTKAQIEKLFDEYARFNIDANRTTEGTGLGMSITQNLIRMMDGDIFIESEPGKGTTITVHLPQKKSGDGILGADVVKNLCQFRTSSRAQMKRVQITREPMPYGSVLIVDDVESNIYVATGLLSPYGIKIESVNSGYEAIKKIKTGNLYDIIFMDHMMPGMDGVETTKRIRGMGYTKPVVALTANAVSGQADIFLANGFNDFISKPIDVRQLNNVLNKLIRDKQPPEVIEAARKLTSNDQPESPSGILNGDMSYSNTVEFFIRDAVNFIEFLNSFIEKNDFNDEDAIKAYVINVHGIKSALANIGKMDLSAVALKLETAGRENNFDIIRNETSAFLTSLQKYIRKLSSKKKALSGDGLDADIHLLHIKLQEIKEACEIYNENAANEGLKELRNKTWSASTVEMLDNISVKLLHSDFDEVIDVIDKFNEGRTE